MLKFAANLTMMFTEVPFLQRFERAAQAGFLGVEYLFPYEHDAILLKTVLDRHQLQQVLFNMPPGDWDNGERGLASLPGREAEFKEGVDIALEYALALNSRQIHVMAGLLQPNVSLIEQQTCYINNVRYAADKLAAHNIRLLIEPINRRDMSGYFLTTTRQAESLLAEINCPNLFIQLDLYHCQIMQGDLLKTIQHLWGRFSHLQIASVPFRHEPDSGEINYSWLFSQLEVMGYDGWLGCEYRPVGLTEAGLTWFNLYKTESLRSKG